jgi:glutathionylspermidine synthase
MVRKVLFTRIMFTLPNFSDYYPVIGSWIIGQEPAGMGIREADTFGYG